MRKQEMLCYKKALDSSCIKAKASGISVRFKTLVEAANAVRGMSVCRAELYLKNVLAHKECVPFKNSKSGVGKCSQAKQFKTIHGRWPYKAVKCLQDLLRNAVSNAEFQGKDPTDLYICHIFASQAPTSLRKTFRAHGRINSYERHLSHIQMILKTKNYD
ncbi:large ribosomal subunit protein uL22-like [Rhynchophorus ferrugineus]|uniref:large ribosomal subunit protein uL22-like n=1 Tax=Rhynchophorus ferrugineus TaxID=354439 RepID=UPI003FCDF796